MGKSLIERAQTRAAAATSQFVAAHNELLAANEWLERAEQEHGDLEAHHRRMAAVASERRVANQVTIDRLRDLIPEA